MLAVFCSLLFYIHCLTLFLGEKLIGKLLLAQKLYKLAPDALNIEGVESEVNNVALGKIHAVLAFLIFLNAKHEAGIRPQNITRLSANHM